MFRINYNVLLSWRCICGRREIFLVCNLSVTQHLCLENTGSVMFLTLTGVICVTFVYVKFELGKINGHRHRLVVGIWTFCFSQLLCFNVDGWTVVTNGV